MEDAYKQFKDTEDWRKANQLEVLYETIDVEAYEETRSLVGPLCLNNQEAHSDSQ